MSLIKRFLGSRKWVATIVTAIVALAARFGWDVDQEMISDLVYLVIAAILGTGIEDFGKGAK